MYLENKQIDKAEVIYASALMAIKAEFTVRYNQKIWGDYTKKEKENLHR